MRASTTQSNLKAFGVGLISIISVGLLAISWLVTAANASSVIHVSSNVADVAATGDSLVLTIGTQNDGDVWELEVDHNFDDIHPGILPEFSVYADEADPYGGDGALFAAVGASVTYSAADNQWVLDFGDDLTSDIIATGDNIVFYLALLDADGNYLWGGMSPTAPENTFTYDLVSGTGDLLMPEPVEEDEVVIPGVPNTGLGR